MELEFDCPQYYDFETGKDVSNPEAYFQTMHDFSPGSEELDSLPFKSKTQPVTVATPVSTQNSEPYKNTRSSLKKPQTLSSLFRSRTEPPAKKPKVNLTRNLNASRIPAPVNEMQIRSALHCANKENKPTEGKLQIRAQKRGLTGTVPEPFSFATDKRLKTDNAEKTEYKPFDYAGTLRNNRENKGNDKSNILRKGGISDKRTLLSFQQGRSEKMKPGAKGKYRSVTVPVTPHLRTASRVRNFNQEAKVDVKVAPKPQTLTHLAKKTVIYPPVVKVRNPVENVPRAQTADRCTVLRPRPTSQKCYTEFKARPVPKHIFEGVTGLKVRPQVKTTEAHSPSFLLKKRAEAWKQHEEAKDKEVADGNNATTAHQRRSNFVSSSFKAPVQDPSLLLKKRAMENAVKVNEAAPKILRRQLPQKSTLCQDPKVSAVVQTRAIQRASEWQKKMEEEMKQQKENLLFKARPCTVTRMKPFQPVKSNKLPTKAFGFQFQSDLRLLQRKKNNQESEQKSNAECKALEEPMESVPQVNPSSLLDKPIKVERLSIPNALHI